MDRTAQTETQRIAVAMTCHNRRPSTLACLEALHRQDLPAGHDVSVFLVDDGSSDGTSAAVREAYPAVRIIPGDGSLYWNGGMRLAFGTAMQEDFDFYLWLNDDTNLYPNAIGTLLTVWREKSGAGGGCIVVGSTRDADTGAFTYGGLVKASRWHPLKFAKTPPQARTIPCATFGGNCVLVPRGVAQRLGNLDAAFSHLMGDTDYGLRAGKAGIGVWIAPGFQGTCAANPAGDYVTDSSLSLRERIARTLSPKGMPPREWRVIARRHGGVLWWLFSILPYVRLAMIAAAADARKVLGKAATGRG